MQNVFDYNQQADQSLMGGARAERALGIPVQRGLPGSFAPGSSNAQADSLLAGMEQGTQDMLAARTKPQRPPVVGYNPDTEEVFSGGKTFKLDLDQGAANAALLDMDNTDLPPGFTAVYGDSVKQKLVKEYESLGLVDAFQRRAGQALGNVGSTMQDLGMKGIGQSMQDTGGALARRNPSHITSATDLMESPGQAATEALGEVAYDVPMAIAQTAVGAKIGAGLGALAAPVTGGASIPIGAFLGGAAGRFIGTLAETYGSVRSEQREAGIDNKGRALAAGSGSAALEALLGPEAAAGNLLGRAMTKQALNTTTGAAARLTGGGMAKYLGKQALIGGAVEGPLTEVPQSAIERWGAEKDLTGDGAMDEYAIGAFKGAVGGAAASPLASVPEYVQAKNFIANLQEDMQIAANPEVPSGQRVAAARRAQDVLRGSSEDPLFNEQLQEFRQKLQYIDTLIVDNSTKEAVANGEAVNLLDLAPQRDLFARGDTTVQQPPAPEPEEPPLTGAVLGDDELFDETGAPTYGADTSFGVSPFEREQTFEGPRITPEQRVVAGLPALNEVLDQIQAGTLPRAVSDDLTPGQQAALAGPARPVSGALTPGQQVAAAGPDPMTGFQRALQGVTLDLEAPAAPTPVATVVSSPLQGDLSAAGSVAADSFTPDADADVADIEAELDKVLKAQAASTPGQAKGRMNVPQGVLAAVARSIRGNKSPVVYQTKTMNPDAAVTAEWSERMRDMVDAAKKVAEAFKALSAAETSMVPSDSRDKKKAEKENRALTKADVDTASTKADEGYAKITALRGQLRTAIDNMREVSGGDMNAEAIVGALKRRVQESKLKEQDLGKTKADTSLDVNLSQAWAQFKDGALDTVESSDVVRPRSIRESLELKRRGLTDPPNVVAATEGSTRRPMRQGENESDARFKQRTKEQLEFGISGIVSRLQLHGTGYEKLLAAGIGRALRRFIGTPQEPSLAWVDPDTKPYYDPKTNTVYLHKEASPEEILHETLHSALQWYVYQNPDTAEVKMLMQALDKVLAMDPAKFSPKAAEVVAVLRRVAKGKSKTARLDAVLELVSYGSTLSDFRNALKQISSVQDADAGTMSGLTAIWQRLTALIQRFLGVSNTVANDVLDGTVALLEMAADPGIDAPGKRKGNILKAEVMSGMDPTSSIPELLGRPGSELPSDIDVARYNKKILPSFLSTKFIFDAIGWKSVVDKAVNGKYGTAAAADKIRDDFPGLARWLTYVNTRFSVPVDSRESFEQYKDDKQAGYKMAERLATRIERMPAGDVLRLFKYLDGDKTVLADDEALSELADEVVRWRDFYVSRLGNDKATRFFSSGEFSETMLFANTEEQVAGQTFGLRKLNTLLSERKQVEENLETSWMMLDAHGDPMLDGKFFEVFHLDPAGAKVHDGFIAVDKFNGQYKGQPPAGHMVDEEYVWFHTSYANGKHNFRASMTVKQAVQTQQADKLANAMRNTFSALANNFASKQFSDSLATYGHSDGHPDNAVAFDDIAHAERVLKIKIDPKNVLKAGGDQARSAQTQHLYRSPHLWVQLPNSDAYGALKGKLIKSGVWMAMQDMSDRRPAVNIRALNTGMRWFKKSKTVYNPGTHITNIATNFTLATMHDIPMATIKEAARLMAQYEFRPNTMKKSERQLVLAFINSNAMIGDFSSAEVKQSLYNAMRDSLEGDTSIAGRLTALTRLEKAKAEAVQKYAGKGKDMAARFDEAVTGLYSAEDNVFRMAAYLKHAADLSAQHDGNLTAEDLQAAGDFARWAFLDYDIDAKAVRMARQTVLPFISWTYAFIPVFGKIAVHQPWKIANIMLAFTLLEHVAQELTGGDDEDERLRKAGPEYIRDRMFGVGPYAHIRIPFLGDEKTPVYYRLGDYLPWTSVVRGQPNGFMGIDWYPSAVAPTGPLVSSLITAIAGVDPYFGKPLSPPTDSNWEKFLTRSREIAAQVVPPMMVDFMRKDRVDDIMKGRTDKPEGFEALQVARWFGLKAYGFNEDQALVAQSRAAKAIMSEYKQEIGRLRRAEARFERPDWERFAKRQTELLQRMQDEISELRGE